MTRLRRHDRDTPYCAWLRNNPQLDSQMYGYDRGDIDMVWFQYKLGNIMIIEEKCFGSPPTPAEKDTHAILHQALRFACPRMDFSRYFQGRTTELHYFGYHLVQFENTGPLDGSVMIDNILVTLDYLLLFHKFAWFPKLTKIYGRLSGRPWIREFPEDPEEMIQQLVEQGILDERIYK